MFGWFKSKTKSGRVPDSEYMVEMTDVGKTYQSDVVALKDVTLKVSRGETVCFIGPSGSGKSTLLKTINHMVVPTSGSVLVEGQDTRESDLISLRRRTGYVIQSGGLFPHLTVYQNLSMMPECEGWPTAKIRKRVDWLLKAVKLSPQELDGRYPSELSGGQAQRVGIARAMMLAPELILMDEPFGSLDPLTRRALQDEFIDLKREMNKTICLVTHDMEEAFRLGDRVAILRDGQLLQIGTESELRNGAASDFVNEFLDAHAEIHPVSHGESRQAL